LYLIKKQHQWSIQHLERFSKEFFVRVQYFFQGNSEHSMGHVEREEELSVLGRIDFRIELKQHGGFP